MSELTEKQRRRIVQWLESMPWWEELPYAQLEDKNERLKKRDEFLSALEQAGVDNWSGYSYAFEILEALGGGDD